MAERTRTAPRIPGLEIHECIGQGGFATVYKAWQQRPGRDVAVKVLEGDNFDSERLRQFEVETKAMAQVSSHPSIVTILDADIAPDGRPYILMELYSGGHYGQLAKGGRLPQDEVLRVMISIASAVETAHRAGILHRDIKPENILRNAYNRPGLTDFGIASARFTESDGHEAMTVPYAAPELLRDSGRPSEASDVYALGATGWALLAGRSPFETGRSEPALDLMRRILNDPVPPLPRDGVHPRLEQVLRQALEKDPSARPATAREFAAALQRIQTELGVLRTEIDLPSEAPASGQGDGRLSPPDGQHDDRTRVRAVVNPSPRPDTSGSTATRDDTQGQTDDRTKQRGVEPAPPVRPQEEPTPKRPATSRSILVASAAVLLVLGGFLVNGLIAWPSTPDEPNQSGLPTTTADVGEPLRVPVLELLEMARPSPTRVEIRWMAQDPQPGDELLVRRMDEGHAWAEPRAFTISPAEIEVEADGTPCFSVWVVSGTRMSEQASGCAWTRDAS